MVVAIAATICAAALVLFLQYRAISALESHSRVILRQVSEQSAADIAEALRRTLDGPVFDTLTAVNHPELRAGRLDLVAEQFQAGLVAYPHVDRFLAWSAQTEAKHPGQAMFFGRDGSFTSDPSLGRAIIALARHHAPAQQIYVAAERLLPESNHQVFLRLFWTDARRLEYFAILGFVVEPSRLREHLFGGERRQQLQALLDRRGGGLALQLTVNDETGTPVYGRAAGAGHGSRVSFPMLFYPAEVLQSRLAATVEPREWTIEVSPLPPGGAFWRAIETYGPSALSVVLILVALGLSVQAHRRSEELAEMQTEFVAHVSHQLKTPLSLLSAATETLEMDRVRSPERFAEYLRTIHAEAARLSSLVQRVLEFSRVQQGRNYEFERVDLGALVRETVDAFEHGLSSQHFRFTVVHEGPSPFVRADPVALEQAIANLLDNAVKYSTSIKEVVVAVRTEGGQAVVAITDHGVGIAPRDHARIFERFYRTSGSERPGFGLGLPIVRELIHAHRGRVDVTSAPGAGSTFRIWLPLDHTDPLAAGTTAVEISKGAS